MMHKLTASDAIRNRCSIRDFKPDAIPAATIEAILDVARHAPSGGNVQPWKVIAIAGKAREAVISLAQDALAAGLSVVDDYPVYPTPLAEPYRTRRRRVAEQLYAALGIRFDDKGARAAQMNRNFTFFGAPVALFFIIDKDMGHSQWADLGMFIQSVVLAASDHGLGSCLQEAWAPMRTVLARHFELGNSEIIYCGMALGHPREEATVNAIKTERMPVGAFSRFLGF